MGLFNILKKVGQGIVGTLPGGGLINQGIDLAGGLLQGGGRGGAPRPGFELGTLPTAQFTFGTDPSQIDTGAGFQVPEGLREAISLPGMDPATRQVIQASMGSLGDLSTFAAGAGKDFLSGAAGDLGGARDFYRSLATGDAAAKAEALAPELNEIRRAGKASMENINRFTGRGGGRGLAQQRALIDQAGRQASLLASARPMGAAGLTQLGQISGQLGLGAGSLGATAGQAAAGIGLDTAALDQRRAAQEAGLNLDRLGTLGQLDLSGRGLDLNREQMINQLLLGGQQMQQAGVLGQDRLRLGQAGLGLENRAQQTGAAGALGASGGIGGMIGGIIDTIKGKKDEVVGSGGGDFMRTPPFNPNAPGASRMFSTAPITANFGYNPRTTPYSGQLGKQFDKTFQKGFGAVPTV